MTDAERTERIIEGLTRAYWMEIETVLNYLANSVHLDGVRAEEIKKALGADVQAEIGHAQVLATRIKEIGGPIPGSMQFTPEQSSLQPPDDPTDVVAVIRGVIEAENGAIDHYKSIIADCEGFDYVTQDLCIRLLADEEGHRRQFRGYLTEYEKS